MASTRLGYLAVKKETTRGTVVKPTNFIRFKDGSISYDQEIIENNPIQNVRWNALNAVPGKIATDGSYSLDADMRDIGYFLMTGLGTYAPTSLGSGAYRHTFNTANKLPSLSLEQLQGDSTGADNVVTRAFGVLVDKIEMSGSDGIVSFSADVKATGVFLKSNLVATAAIGAPSTIDIQSSEGLVVGDLIAVAETSGALSTENTTIVAVTDDDTITANLAAAKTLANAPKVELRAQTPSYTKPPLVASFIHAAFQFGTNLTTAASAVEENVENWTFTYMNNLEERYGSLRATPSVIAEKGVGATLKYAKYFETRIDRDRYMDQTRRACILTLTLPDLVGSSTNKTSLTFKMSDLRFTGYKMDTGSDDVYVAEIEASLFYDQTDGKAIQVELVNDIADYAV